MMASPRARPRTTSSFKGGALDEADLAKVARVNAQDGRGIRVRLERRLVVADARAVGRAHLDEARAGAREHLRDAEAAADLHLEPAA